MLTTQLRHRLMPDPALPSRDALLDPDAVSPRLSRILGRHGPLDVGRCVLVRAKYRIGESLRVVYRLDIGGSTHLVAGRAFEAGTGAAAAASRRAAAVPVPAGRLRPVAHDVDFDTVWWAFPHDRRLRGLHALLHPALDPRAPLVGGQRWTSSEVVEYAPERSVTLRALGQDHRVSAYIKAYAPDTTDLRTLARRYALVARALARSPLAVSSPRPLWWSDLQHALLLEAMPGRQWDQLGAGALAPAVRRMGAAIATLHECSFETEDTTTGVVPLPFSRFRRLDLTRIVHSAELIGQARPDVAASAARLADALSAHAPAPEPTVLLHGDCHPKNAVLQGDHVALIDLDQAGFGPPATDIGSFLARLVQTRLVDGIDTHDLACAFLDGYSTVRPLPDDASLAWHTSAAVLVERSMRAVNRVHPQVLEHLEGLLAAGHCALRGGQRP